MIAVIETALLAPTMARTSRSLHCVTCSITTGITAVDLAAIVCPTDAEPNPTQGTRRTTMIVQASSEIAE